MKILLVTPPGMRMMNPMTLEPDMLPPKTWVPLGIASLTAALRAAGFDAHSMDLHDADWEEVEQLLGEIGPDIVGISCFTFGRDKAMRTAALTRRVLPQAAVVMGGPHATFFPHQVLAGGDVDIVVKGEGEMSMVALTRVLEQGGDLGEVPGIVYREDEEVRMTDPLSRVENLDIFPFPVYDSFDLSAYKSPEIPECYRDLPGTHVLTSRGMPVYLPVLFRKPVLQRELVVSFPGNVADGLEVLINDFGVRHVYFSDDLFSGSPRRAIGICREIIDRGLDLVWMAETRVDCVDEELLRWMRRAGCYRVYYGVESGSPRILRSINKRFSVRQVAEAFDLTHRAGIEPCCFLMVGNPGETPQTISETVSLINAIRPATMPTIGITTILPGTDLYDLSKKQGLISDEYWLSNDPPPLYTGEHSIDDLISLQMMLTRGICPELYEQLCEIGFDEGYFQLRKSMSVLS